MDSEIYEKGKVVKIEDKVTLLSFLLEILDIDVVKAEDSEVEVDESSIETLLDQETMLLENRSFKILWDMLKDILGIVVVIENDYVDKIYRDSYYAYYSCKHFECSRYCVRLFIFLNKKLELGTEKILNLDIDRLQEAFMGSVVIRPLNTGKIGRTLVDSSYLVQDSCTYIRNATYDVMMFGKRLTVNAFPYSMQDEETTSCAEITILNLLDYFSKKYSDYKFLYPSEIIEIAKQNGYERRLPTKGLDYSLISKVFMEAGFYPVLYNYDKLEDDSKFKRIAHYYIESGIPIGLGIQVNKNIKHSIICIGHEKSSYENLGQKQYSISSTIVDNGTTTNNHIWIIDSADAVDKYIFMDDNRKPYVQYQWKHNLKSEELDFEWKPEYLMVPLYKRMFLEASDAYDICTTILANNDLGIQIANSGMGKKENPVVIRLFMASSRSFEEFRIKNFNDENIEAKEFYINTPLPRFIWVCELFEKDDYPDKCFGEIVVDATSAPSAKVNSVIILHYPRMMYTASTTKKNQYKFHQLIKWEKFNSYRGNLYRQEKTLDGIVN